MSSGTRQLGGVLDDDGTRRARSDHGLREGRLELGDLGVEVPEARPLVVPEPRTRPGERGAPDLEQPGRLRIQGRLAGQVGRVQGVEPRADRGVEVEGVPVPGERGSEGGLDREESLVRPRGDEGPNDTGGPAQETSGPFESGEGVLRGGGLGRLCYRSPFPPLLRQPGGQGRRKVLAADRCEVRQAVRQVRRHGQRVVGGEGAGCGQEVGVGRRLDGGRGHPLILPTVGAGPPKAPSRS